VSKGEIFSARVERLASGGAGIARHQGMTVFIGLCAPGDRLRAKITAVHKTWAEAELVSLEEPSPTRVEPPCPCYGLCGGCSLQHLAYETQLAEKKTILRDAFTRIGAFASLPEIAAIPSPPFEYRNRVQLHYPPPPGAGLAGFMGRGEIVPVTDCPVADPGIRRFLETQKPAAPLPGRKSRFTLFSRGDLLLNENSQTTRGTTPVLGREISLDAGVFFQSNVTMLEKLVPVLLKAAETADRDRPAADLYCGVGTFAAFLRDYFPRVDLVEENGAALDMARANVPGEGHRFVPLSGETWIKSRNPVPRDTAKKTGDGFLVTDPPRQGLSRVMRSWLALNGPPALAYVSCDPATLARDASALRNGGYDLDSLTFFDFYPQTAHIESLAVFRRDR
jgi:23S rRNA (uracil1939-C5)-methyltransferase